MTTFLVTALLFAEPSLLQTTSNEQVALVEKISSGVVFIATDDGFGSGFFVGENGLILTNAHVIGKAVNPRVILHDGRKFLSRVVEVGSEDTDVALIQIDLAHAPFLPLEQTIPKVGEWAGAIGHGAGALFSFNSGMVSNVYAEGAEKPVFQTQIPLNPGNSGGPIFNAKGAVVGIVTSRLSSAASINFGISVDTARRTLKALAAACDTCLRVTAPGKVPVFVNGKMAGLGPVVVVPHMKAERAEVFAVVNGKMLKSSVEFGKERVVELK